MIRGFIFLSIIFIASSCKVSFDRDLRNSIESQGLNLKKIQYYNSQPIVLKRVLNQSEAKVASGEVRLEKGMYIQEIQIKRNTPGICDSLTEDGMYVRFEEGPGRVLLFQDNAYGDYQMKADKWDPKSVGAQTNYGYAEFYQTYRGEVTYDGEKFYTNSTLNKPKLKIKKKESNVISKDTRKASGVKVQ